MRYKLAISLVMIFVLPAWAHHSHGNYESTFMDVQGVVKEVVLVAPHSWIYMEVKGTGSTPEVWALEATGRAALEKIGVTKEYVKAGDTIKAPRISVRHARRRAVQVDRRRTQRRHGADWFFANQKISQILLCQTGIRYTRCIPPLFGKRRPGGDLRRK